MKHSRTNNRGFTLIELLVVSLIIAILATVGFSVFRKGILKARAVETASLGRAVGIGISNFTIENMRPPNPPTRDDLDTIYGDPDGDYSTAFLVGVLTGGSTDFTDTDGTVTPSTELNPNGTVYVELPEARNQKLGVNPDTKRIYDSFGRELIFAINSRRVSQFDNQGDPGFQDEVLHTGGLFDYRDTKPGPRAFAFLSFGADGLKGRSMSEDLLDADQILAGSDDIISW